jgi:molybdenum cofactor biosynthesis enzyme MoaA
VANRSCALAADLIGDLTSRPGGDAALTTNGVLLAQHARLRAAGLQVTVSLDSLDPVCSHGW